MDSEEEKPDEKADLSVARITDRDCLRSGHSGTGKQSPGSLF
jgi:hypothetical protein